MKRKYTLCSVKANKTNTAGAKCRPIYSVTLYSTAAALPILVCIYNVIMAPFLIIAISSLADTIFYHVRDHVTTLFC